MEVVWIDKEWIEELLWCPSQCYRRAKVNGKVYTLYLRWRWEDPWKFMIAEGDMVAQRGPYLIDLKKGKSYHVKGIDEKGELVLEEVKWRFVTDDLFAENNLYFKAEELKQAEKKAEELFLKWLKTKRKQPSKQASEQL